MAAFFAYEKASTQNGNVESSVFSVDRTPSQNTPSLPSNFCRAVLCLSKKRGNACFAPFRICVFRTKKHALVKKHKGGRILLFIWDIFMGIYYLGIGFRSHRFEIGSF